MPRFFFHIHDGREIVDDEGIELPDLNGARNEAVRYAGECLRDHGDAFWNSGDWQLEVADERGMTLFTLTFFASDAPALGNHEKVATIPHKGAGSDGAAGI